MGNNMQNIMYKLYHIFWVIFLVVFFILLAVFRLNIKGHEVKEGYEILHQYESESNTDMSAPIWVRQVYTFNLEGAQEAYSQLMFYTVHQNVRVFLDEVCVYRMVADQIGMSGESPGCVWNQVSFSDDDNGKQVRIEITPVYKSSIDIVPNFYFGNESDIIMDVVSKELPVVFLSLLVMTTGVIYIVFVVYSFQKSTVEKNLLMLGYFALQVGMWKLADTGIIDILFPGRPVFSQIPFMALMLMCVSFSLFVKDLYSTRECMIWYVPVVAGFVNMGLTFLAQFLGVADMRQMLPLTHIEIMIICAVTGLMTIYEIRKIGFSGKLKRNVYCLAACFVGAMIDMAFFHVSNGQSSNIMGMICFTIYILVLGFSSMQDIKELMDIGIKAQRFEKMAYHDQLTGLYNRTAFAEHTTSAGFMLEKCIIIVMDLNNLKKCNDELGHDKGDIYIGECARMIRESFGDIGRCYRMGGDEFYVLLENGNLHLCKQKVQELQERVAKCTKVGNDFRMGIACGYQMYDQRMDYDINETARRADKDMYQQKFAMKEL